MLQEPIHQLNDAIRNGKTRVAAAANALGTQYQEQRRQAGRTKQNPLSLVARMSNGTLKLQWRLLQEGKIKELGANTEITQKSIANVVLQQQGLVLQTALVVKAYRDAWVRLCYLGNWRDVCLRAGGPQMAKRPTTNATDQVTGEVGAECPRLPATVVPSGAQTLAQNRLPAIAPCSCAVPGTG